MDTSAPTDQPTGHDGCSKYRGGEGAGLWHTFYGCGDKHERDHQEDGEAKDNHCRQRTKHHYRSTQSDKGWREGKQEEKVALRNGRDNVY